MKIPEAGNVGAYYGNEENGQWQPNGVIIDNGVGGGVVGSGDAGVHRPPVYPVHMPRGPMPGYVMAGAYYPPAYPPVPAPQDDFADYMWMENEEEFDKQVMQQLEEEALMEQCIEAMLEDEQRERRAPVTNGHNNFATTSNGSNSASLQEAVSRSTLNPLAAEFVPSRARQPPEQDPPETKEGSEKAKEDVQPSSETESPEKVEGSPEKESAPQVETPEVSAADIAPIDETDSKSKEKPKNKPETKKPAKPEPKTKAKKDVKAKVQSDVKCAQSEVKSGKSEVKSVQSEVKSAPSEVKCADEKSDSTEVLKQSSPPPSEEPSSGFKPINYAAAAKANKPKKSITPPITEKPTTQTKTEKPKEKKEKPIVKTKVEKPAVKVEKAVQRKNSTK